MTHMHPLPTGDAYEWAPPCRIPLQPPKSLAEVGPSASHQQVIMVVHQDKGFNLGPEPFRQFRNQSEECPAKEGFPAVPTANHMIPTIHDMAAKRSCHPASLSAGDELSILRDRLHCPHRPDDKSLLIRDPLAANASHTLTRYNRV
jgi:hypothetical protein